MGDKLMVRSLPWTVRERDLEPLFERFGRIRDCRVITERDNPSKSRGFGFITFEDPACAAKALEALDNYELEGRNIRVQYADGRRSDSGAPPSTSNSYPSHSSYDHSRSRDSYNNERDSYRDTRARERSPERSRTSEHHNTRRDEQRDGREYSLQVGSGVDKPLDPENTNTRIYISGLSPETTEKDIAEYFGNLGIIARKKVRQIPKKDWPFKIVIYQGEDGKPKGDATLMYEDPNAAQCAPEFFNGTELKGATIKVQLATVSDKPYTRR